MQSLMTIDALSADQIGEIFARADDAPTLGLDGARGLSVAYSFEGNSIRTRATFLKALADLGVHAIEIPNLLKTAEPVEHLAGYLDNWFDLYIVRDSNHPRMADFAGCSRKPLINAMTSEAHPCEVLADAYSIRARSGDLTELNFCIIGPPTNVLRSWHRLAQVLSLHMTHVLPEGFAAQSLAASHVRLVEEKAGGLEGADIILTDAWPADFQDRRFRLELADLAAARGDAWVIPCPPFNTEHEISADVIRSRYFAGYTQKASLLPVQKALIWALLEK